MEEIKTPEGGSIIPVSIETEMQKSYIYYSMSVIVAPFVASSISF